MPVPANISFKRAHLPSAPAPGWLEYDAPFDAFRDGRMVTAPESRCLHVQDFSRLRSITIQFASGRSYGGALVGQTRRQKLVHLRSRPRFAAVTYRTSRRGLGPRAGVVEHAALAAMVASNVAGQLVGLVRGVGRSRDDLR
jgi:hypothetical protein